MRIQLFGSITAELEERQWDARSFGGRKPKQLFEILVLRRGHPTSTGDLAERLWGDAPPADYPSTVQHYVSVLRRRLPRGDQRGSMLLSARGGYELDVDRIDVDIDTFDVTAAAADGAGPDDRRRLLAMALDLVRGDLLADEPDAEWATETRQRYRRLHARLLLQASAAALVAAEPVEARDLALAAVAHEASAEPAACLLIAAHYVTGDRPAALAAYERCRQGLLHVLGLDPMPQTVELQRAVLAHASFAQVVADAVEVARVQSPRLVANHVFA